MCICASTLKIPSTGNFRHRNLRNIFYWQKNYLRMACFDIWRRKTQQNSGCRFKKRIACWQGEVKSHIRLPGQLTTNYFADLKWEKLLWRRTINFLGGRLTFCPNPKYQNSPFKLAPQPREANASSPCLISKERFSLIFPKYHPTQIPGIWGNLLTIEINDHGYIGVVSGGQYQNSIGCWWRSCFRLRLSRWTLSWSFCI